MMRLTRDDIENFNHMFNYNDIYYDIESIEEQIKRLYLIGCNKLYFRKLLEFKDYAIKNNQSTVELFSKVLKS